MGNMLHNLGQYCGGVFYQYDAMVGHVCRPIFITQAINPFSSARVFLIPYAGGRWKVCLSQGIFFGISITLLYKYV